MAAGQEWKAAARTALQKWWWAYPLVFIPACLAVTSWWLTAPLADRGGALVGPTDAPPVPIAPEVEAVVEKESPPAWPEGRLDGVPAKRLLLDALVRAAERLNKVEAYTATFVKQERIKGALGPEQTMAMKVRQRPFAIYLKFLAPQQGKEVVYAEGHHDNKVIAHSGGLARMLVPRLAVAPDHPLALADSRHAVTEAGLANLTGRLIGFRKMDLDDPEAVTVLDRVTDAKGRLRFRSVHLHPNYHPERPFARVEVLYEPETLFPVDIRNYDWPKPGESGDLKLAEHYAYDGLKLDAPLTALDFDPANPSYEFHRF
jgi:hypothetical protein